MTKAVLSRIVGVLTLVLVAGIVIPFASSLDVNAKARAQRPHVLVSDLQPSGYRISFIGRATAFLLFRTTAGSLRVWSMPAPDGRRLMMPDKGWKRWLFSCENFGLHETRKTFECLDAEIQESKFFARELSWDTSGKNLGVYTENLVPVQGSVEGKYFVAEKGWQ